MSRTNYLDRFLDPVADVLTPEVAERLVGLHVEDDPQLHAHIEDLRQKSKAGTLTPEEEADYKEFVEAVDVIAVLQSKARRFLSRNIA